MFGAPQAFAHQIPTGIAQPGYSYWRALELTLTTQWYILSLFHRDGGISVQRDLLVSWSADLVSIIAERRRDEICSIQLVEPADRHGEEGWCTRTVSSVWLGRDPGLQKHSVPVFETTSGGRSCDPMDRGSPVGLVDLTLLWARPPLA